MLRFVTKWIVRGALIAGVASATHSCGAAHLYGDDEAFSANTTSDGAHQHNRRPQ